MSVAAAINAPPALAIRVRNLREGEADTLPAALRDHGMLFLIPEWVWVVEPSSPLGPFAPSTPFAIIVGAQAHSWLLLCRVLAVSPLPPAASLNWFLEALPQVFAEARQRGCVGFVTLLDDNRPEEVKMARIIMRLAKGGIVPFHGSVGAGMLIDSLEPATAPLVREV